MISADAPQTERERFARFLKGLAEGAFAVDEWQGPASNVGHEIELVTRRVFRVESRSASRFHGSPTHEKPPFNRS